MTRRLLWQAPLLVLLAGFVQSHQCGPSDAEAAAAVLLATPAVVLLAGVLLQALAALWRRFVPGLRMAWGPTLLAAAASLLLVPLALAGPESLHGALEWFVAALWLYGTSYVSVLVVTWRIAAFASPAWAFKYAHFVPLGGFVLPAVPLLFAGSESDDFLGYWVFPGYAGIVAGILYGIVLIEALVRFFVAGSRAQKHGAVPAPAGVAAPPAASAPAEVPPAPTRGPSGSGPRAVLLAIALAGGLCLGAPRAHAAPPEPTIELVTMTKGRDLFTAYGHTAVRVIDPIAQTDVAYDFGMYEYTDPQLLQKFFLGELRYWVEASEWPASLQFYRGEFGGVMTQTLQFPPGQARFVADELAKNILPENRYYRYHHFFDNCATRVRDLFDRAYAGALARQARGQPSGTTLRGLIACSTRDVPPVGWIVYGLLAGPLDEPADRWTQMFLPHFLAEEMARLTFPDAAGRPTPAVQSTRQLLGTPPHLPPPPSWAWFGGVFAGLLVLGAWPWLLARRRPRLVRIAASVQLALGSLVSGVYGLVLLAGWILAAYPEQRENANLLATHPGALGLVPFAVLAAFGWPRARRIAAWGGLGCGALALVGLGLQALGVVQQQSAGYMLFALLVLALPAATLLRLPR